MADRIQMRRDTLANWSAYNPILLEGEHGYVLDDANLYKMGDGIHAWNDLPWRGYNGNVLQDLQDGVENSVPSSEAVLKYYGRYIENQEWLKVIVDSDYKVLCGLKTDGKFYANIAGLDEKLQIIVDEFMSYIQETEATIEATIDEKMAKFDELFETIDNPEFIEAKTDSEGKLLAGRTPDGVAFENVGFATPKVSIDGNTIKTIEDPDGRHEITLDSEDRIISYRKPDGTKVENVGLCTNRLELTSEGMTEFQKALKDSGFNPSGSGNWTDAKNIEIPIPRCALVNITNADGNAVWPTSKENNYKYYMQFWDMQGNYFSKEVVFNAQGRSSMGFEKKNGAVDICNNNGWDDDDTFKIKFGDWVAQDSFHFKAYYCDFFRGINVAAYNLIEQIWKSRGIRADRPWKKMLIDFSKIGTDYVSTKWETDDMSLQMDNGARCIPDGFPAIFYLNGEFFGIYSWQLKKHRDNYHMKKDNAKHIHLDGNIDWDTLWGANGNSDNVNWDTSSAVSAGFEIRNPKDIWTMAGKKYDADNNMRQEPVDTATAESWIAAGQLPDGTTITSKISKQLTTTGKVKKAILDFSKVLPMLTTMKDGGSTDAEIRSYFETYFDVDNIIDYLLFSALIYNWDGFRSNWQWTTWDGKKWFICPYDCDNALGGFERGSFIMHTDAVLFGNTLTNPCGWVIKYYGQSIRDRWAFLKANVVKEDTITDLIMNWMSRVGQDNYKKEWDKWPFTPPNRDSNINADYWKFLGQISGTPGDGGAYDPETPYSVGNVCWQKGDYWYAFLCIQDCTGEAPVKDDGIYTESATPLLGFHDNIWRAENTSKYLYQRMETGIETAITNAENN